MNKSIGMIRNVDEFGRVVIPIEIRHRFDIDQKDPLEIFVDGEKIILKKYVPSCTFCGNIKELQKFKDKLVCCKCVIKMHNTIQQCKIEE